MDCIQVIPHAHVTNLSLISVQVAGQMRSLQDDHEYILAQHAGVDTLALFESI